MRSFFEANLEYLIVLAVILVLVLGTHRFADGNANNAFSKVQSESQ